MARKLLAFTVACDGAMTTEGYFEMRYLLNTLVSLTIVLIGFALAQPARAFVTNGDTTPPTVSNVLLIPDTWIETDDIFGDIKFEFNDGTDPFSYVFDFAFETLGPITIGEVTLTPIGTPDLNGYINALAQAPFTYVAGSGFGIFDLTVRVTDPSGNEGVGVGSFTINSIPEPAAISLFAVGLAGLGFLMRRRRNWRRQS